MADALQRQQFGMGNLADQRLGMTVGKQRIRRTVNHQGRCGDLVKPPARQLTLLGQRVVHHAGSHVVGAVNDPLHERAHVRLVEVLRGLQAPLVADDVIDHRRPFGPIRQRDLSGEVGPQVLRHRRKLRPARAARDRGTCRDQYQRVNATRMSQGNLLREGAAHRHTGQVSAPPPKRVQHPGRIGRQVRAGVLWRPGWVADRLPGVAMVVADDISAARRQPLAEFLLPPVHRAAHAADEQDRGVSRVASSIHAQVNPVDLDDPVAVHKLSGTEMRWSGRRASASDLFPVTIVTPALMAAYGYLSPVRRRRGAGLIAPSVRHRARPPGGPPAWPPVPESPAGRPIPQWPRLEAGHSDDLTAGP